jgi:hypothetical protein
LSACGDKSRNPVLLVLISSASREVIVTNLRGDLPIRASFG